MPEHLKHCAFFGALLTLALCALPAPAQTLGMAVDSATNKAVVFNADTDTVIGSASITGLNGDCVITGDQSLGFVTDFASTVFVINLTTTPPTLASGTNPIPISNTGEDLSLSPDGAFVVACDGSLPSPVSVISIASKSQVNTLSTGSDCNSVDVASNGSVLVTSS